MFRAPRAPAIALLSLAALLLLAACSGSEAPPTANGSPALATPEASATTEAAPTSATSATPPVAVATVTVQVPAGPQTERLLLVEDRALVIQEIDGSRREVAAIEAGAGSLAFASWSPDGDTIAFVQRTFFSGDTEADFGDDVYLVAVSGGAPRMVRAHLERGEQVFGLAWRPDGTQLLLGQITLELRNGVPTAIESAAVVEFDLATGAERPIVDGAYDPSISADGTRLAYVALGELPTQTSIVAANGDGSDPTVLAESALFEVMRFARISPDGSTVAFTAAAPLVRSPEGGSRLAGWLGALLGPFAPHRAEAHGIPMDVWLVDSRTAEVRRLTAIGEDDPFPAWSADGETVVFIGTNGLYEASTGDGALVRTGEGRFDGQVAVAPSN